MKIARKVTMCRAKTKASRRNFTKQKVIYIAKPYHLKTCMQPLIGERAPTLPLQTVNNLQLSVNQTCISPKRLDQTI